MRATPAIPGPPLRSFPTRSSFSTAHRKRPGPQPRYANPYFGKACYTRTERLWTPPGSGMFVTR